MSREIAALSSE